MNYPTDADVDEPWKKLQDYQKVNLVSQHYDLLGMTKEQASKYVFSVPPTEPEVLKSFQEIGVLGFTQVDKEGRPTGTVYVSDESSVFIYTVTLDGYIADSPTCTYTSIEVEMDQFEIPPLKSDMILDIRTRHNVKRQRASELRGFYLEVVDDLVRDYMHVVDYGTTKGYDGYEQEAVMIYVNGIVFDVAMEELPFPHELVPKLERAIYEKTGVDM